MARKQSNVLLVAALSLLVGGLVVFVVMRSQGTPVSEIPRKVASGAGNVLKSLLPVNIRTRGSLGPWMPLGIVHSVDPQEDSVLQLEGRKVDTSRGTYRYRVHDTDKGITIELNKGDDMDELEDDAIIASIPGREGAGSFQVQLSKKPDIIFLG